MEKPSFFRKYGITIPRISTLLGVISISIVFMTFGFAVLEVMVSGCCDLGNPALVHNCTEGLRSCRLVDDLGIEGIFPFVFCFFNGLVAIGFLKLFNKFKIPAVINIALIPLVFGLTILFDILIAGFILY